MDIKKEIRDGKSTEEILKSFTEEINKAAEEIRQEEEAKEAAKLKETTLNEIRYELAEILLEYLFEIGLVEQSSFNTYESQEKVCEQFVDILKSFEKSLTKNNNHKKSSGLWSYFDLFF